MKMLKILFPLSFNKHTPNKFFISLVVYLAIYIAGGFIPLRAVGMVFSIYVFTGALLLMIDYYVWSKKQAQHDENEDNENESN